MAPAQSKRRSRKRRRAAASARGPASQTSPAVRPPAPSHPPGSQGVISTTLTGRTYGEPPPNPFGGLPVSELAIFFGAIAVIVGLASTASPALVVGIIVCVLGVGEVTAREHFSGYRSHTTLLAALPAVGVGVVLIALVGGSLHRGTLLLIVIPIFAIGCWLLRKRFVRARQARVVRPPAP